ncbi:MAG: MmcQ/YjbR family DNA-binding protein [Planctomycetes bacterium]|nr:MmcQ/YjbR family DNA-binding protein [Planctomycetota bacterium]
MHNRRTRESSTCRTLREAALRFPLATQHEPWDHYAIKVKNKTFVFLADGEEGFSISCKLADSLADAKTLPFAAPTGYGLGKSGWMTASFGEAGDAPIALLLRWIDESYRLIAPKKVVATMATAGKVATIGAGGVSRKARSTAGATTGGKSRKGKTAKPKTASRRR